MPDNAAPSNSAGLFVGINRFTKDRTISALNFAVNDAIAIAHFFVVESEQIQGEKATLAISGKPDGPIASEQLEALIKKRVKVSDADRSALLESLTNLKNTAKRFTSGESQSYVVVTFSTHGCELGGNVFVLPSDGMVDDSTRMKQTCLTVTELRDDLHKTGAGRQLLILDACRNQAFENRKSLSNSMSAEWERVLKADDALGEVQITACSTGQVAWEYPQKRQGLFTVGLLEGLRSAAECDAQGAVRVQHLQTYLAQRMRELQSELPSTTEQTPWFAASTKTNLMPLTVRPEVLRVRKKRLEQLRSNAAARKFGGDAERNQRIREHGERLLNASTELSEPDRNRLRVLIDVVDQNSLPESLWSAWEKQGPLPSLNGPMGLWQLGHERLKITETEMNRWVTLSPETERIRIEGDHIDLVKKPIERIEFELSQNGGTLILRGPRPGDGGKNYRRVDEVQLAKSIESARRALNAGNWKEGLDAIDDARKLHPYHAEVDELRRELTFKQSAEERTKMETALTDRLEHEDYVEAVRIIDGILRLGGDSDTYKKKRESTQKRAEEAQQFQTHFGAAKGFQETGQIEDALSALDRALGIKPDDKEALNLRKTLAETAPDGLVPVGLPNGLWAGADLRIEITASEFVIYGPDQPPSRATLTREKTHLKLQFGARTRELQYTLTANGQGLFLEEGAAAPTKLTRIDTTSLKKCLVIANAARSRSQIDLALSEIDKALKLHPYHPEALILRQELQVGENEKR
ncbi:MAG: caspase domain-containing protein [Planctomycetaceae bacterium]